MTGYQIQFSLSSDVNQATLTDKLKSIGDVIQTASGLCFKTDQPESAVSALLSDAGFSGLNIKKVDSRDEALSPDVKVFLEK